METGFKFLAWWAKPVSLEELLEGGKFHYWVAYSYYGKNLDVGQLMGFMGDIKDPEVVNGYEAPYPDVRYKAGAQVFLDQEEPERGRVLAPPKNRDHVEALLPHYVWRP